MSNTNANSFSEWLYNRYLLSKKGYTGHLTETSEILLEALQIHLATNLQTRQTRSEKRQTVDLLKHLKTQRLNSLGYIGSESAQLGKLDERARRFWAVQRDCLEKSISMIDFCTEKKAIALAAKLRRSIEGFRKLKLTQTDDAYLRAAAKNLQYLLERNGCAIDGGGKIIEIKNMFKDGNEN